MGIFKYKYIEAETKFPFRIAYTYILKNSSILYRIGCFTLGVLFILINTYIATLICAVSWYSLFLWITGSKGKSLRLINDASKAYCNQKEGIAMHILQEAYQFFPSHPLLNCINEVEEELNIEAYIIKERNKEAQRRVDADERTKQEKLNLFYQ
ncbi:MAG: hypothetical protein ACEPOV_06835 [Hyphomicrobiales bacterium]